MPGFEALACCRAIIVAVSFRSEVYDFLLTVLTAFDHFLFSCTRRWSRTVTGHVFFTYCHVISISCASESLVVYIAAARRRSLSCAVLPALEPKLIFEQGGTVYVVVD